MFKLIGKTALVTGATGGIGRAIVKTLHGLGAKIAMTDMNRAALDAFAAELGERVRVYEANLMDAESIKKMVSEVEKDMGQIDILVNNAGMTKDGLAVRMTDDQFKMVLNLNLVAPFILMRSVMMGMMKRRSGRIINMASIVGVMGNAGQANYCASKGGLIASSKAIAGELAGRGVTVNCVAPGFVKTPMTDVLPDDVKTKMLNAIPMARLGEPEDIANAVAFLASDEAGYITGQTLHVNGGMAMI